MNLIQRFEKKLWGFPITRNLLSQNGATLYKTIYQLNTVLRFISVPRSVHILLTTNCNCACSHCEANAGIENYELEAGIIKNILMSLIHRKTPRVIFTGGEPLLRSDIFELISFAKSAGLMVTLATNGLLVKPLQNKLKQALPDSIFTSIDGLKKTHEKTRGVKGSYSKTMEAIQIFSSMGIKNIMVNTVVTEENINFLENIGTEIFNAGATLWRLSPIMPVGRAKQQNKLSLSSKNIEKLIDFLCNTHFRPKIDLNQECSGLGPMDGKIRQQPFFCGAGYKICAIMATGDVVPCHVVYNSKASVGNIYEEEFDVLWKRCLQKIKQTPFFSACNKCPFLKNCQGGCWGMRYNDNKCLNLQRYSL